MLCTSNMHWFCMFLSCALFLLPLWASTGPGHALSLYWVQYNCNRTGYKPYNIYIERDIFGRKKVFIVQGATMEAILLCVCAQKYSYIVYMISETLNTQNGNSQMRHILHCTAHCSAHTHTLHTRTTHNRNLWPMHFYTNVLRAYTTLSSSISISSSDALISYYSIIPTPGHCCHWYASWMEWNDFPIVVAMTFLSVLFWRTSAIASWTSSFVRSHTGIVVINRWG